MKKFLINSVIISVIFSPVMTLAQVATDISTTETTITAPTESETIVTSPWSDGALSGVVITVKAEVIVTETPNPALDVVYCGDKFIYSAGTYDQHDQPVKAPICTTYNIMYASYTTVDFGATVGLPVHHFDVNKDGKIVFNELMSVSEIVDKVVRGETDSQYYQVQGGEGFAYLIPISESSVKSMLGQNYQDKIVYFDDSIIYSYKIVK